MKGAVVWITGLAGSGKSTLARQLQKFLLERGVSSIHLDGDELRSTICEDLGYLPEDRKKAANRYARLCHLLSSQDQIVICSTISMFHDVQAWNRSHLNNYIEVFLDPDPAILQQRNQKGLYSSPNQVMGINFSAETPIKPDFHITAQDKNAVVIDSITKLILESPIKTGREHEVQN